MTGKPVIGALRERCREASPSSEPGTAGRATPKSVREALAEVEGQLDRDPETGQFLPGNVMRGKSLARSGALWSALTDAKRELIHRLQSDLAVGDGVATTLEGLLDAYAEATLLRRAMFIRLSELGGAVTTKGKTRALFNTYLQALDRERRLALDLGLERRPKEADPLDAVRRAVKEANA